MIYRPAPIETDHISLPSELVDLVERLARNSHDVWGRMRQSEGWTYGPTRNDCNKRHPDLVEYERLSETEKEYDRELARQLLKTLIAFGYTVSRELPQE